MLETIGAVFAGICYIAVGVTQLNYYPDGKVCGYHLWGVARIESVLICALGILAIVVGCITLREVPRRKKIIAVFIWGFLTVLAKTCSTILFFMATNSCELIRDMDTVEWDIFRISLVFSLSFSATYFCFVLLALRS